MKHKAKPVKGSARTKRFDVGGTVGALAGLGTLAYLMSRKKKGEEGKELGKLGKFPQEAGDGTSGPGMADTTPKVDEGRKRALAASKGLSDMVPEGADKSVMESDVGAKRVGTTPVAKKTAPVVKKAKSATTTAPKQGSTSTTGVDAGIEAGKKAKPTPLTSKPYPSASEQAAAKKDTADKLAKIKETAAKKKAAAKPPEKKPGDVTFLTKERSDAAKESMGRARREQMARLFSGKKAGGTVKKYAEGGVTKSKPAPKKPLPANLQREKDNQDQDRRNRKEREEFDKGAPTRLKEQGSMFKSGGMTASKRGDGIAMRGKTKGKMY